MNYRSINSEVFEFTDMPVCFGIRLCGYENRGWTYVTTSLSNTKLKLYLFSLFSKYAIKRSNALSISCFS